MKTPYIVLALALAVPACGKKKAKPLDKPAACDNIYTSYASKQDKKVWTDACMAAPDETIRCVNLIMGEGKDSACKKLVNSPERTALVGILNGKPEAPAPSASPTPAAPALEAAKCPPGFQSEDPKFCIVLPADAKPGDVQKYPQGGQQAFGIGPVLRWYPVADYDQQLGLMDQIPGQGGAKEVRRGDVPAGTGKYLVFEINGSFYAKSIIKGSKWVFTCDSSNPAVDAPVIQSCLTLVVE